MGSIGRSGVPVQRAGVTATSGGEEGWIEGARAGRFVEESPDRLGRLTARIFPSGGVSERARTLFVPRCPPNHEAHREARSSLLFVRSVREASRMERRSAPRRLRRALASLESRARETARGDRSHARASRCSSRLPHRDRSRLRYGRGRDDPLVGPRRATGRPARVGELFVRLGDGRRQAASSF